MKITKLRKNKLGYKIQAARTELMMNHPFFGILLMYLKYVAVDNIKNISTNGKCIFFNPGFLDKLTTYELQFVLCHQMMHIVLGDIWRTPSMKGDEYHRAYDIVANRQLMRLGWRVNSLTHLGKLQYDIPQCDRKLDNLTAAEIFDLFPFKLYMLDDRTRSRYMADTDLYWDFKYIDGDGEDGVLILDSVNSTGYTDVGGKGNADNGSDTSVGEGGTQDFWGTKVREAKKMAEIAVNIKAGKNASNVPEGVKRAIEDNSNGSLNWRRLLNEFIQEEITDYSFSPPDRRFDECDFFLPDFNEKEVYPKDILFMADASGSIRQKQLGVVYAELRAAIDQFGGKLNGMLGFFDTTVTPPIDFESVADLNSIIPYGNGGTDFVPIFEYVRDKMIDRKPSAIVIFTDGYGQFPGEEMALGIPVFWLIDNRNVIPPFGKVARILNEKD